MFDLIVASLGIVQVGWVSDGFAFDAEAGQGVGDDAFSYSIDGHRAKKWHGLKPVNVRLEIIWGGMLLVLTRYRILMAIIGRLET